MKQAGANMVVSCMDVQGNITMARAIQQYGLKATQLWFSGNDQATLEQNKSLMQGVYFSIAHVPYTAPTSIYPGLKLYLTQMKKYEPKYVNDEIAIQGWESAALFVQGVKMAGNNLTQANVIKEDQHAHRRSPPAASLPRRTGRAPATPATPRRTAAPTSRRWAPSTCRR